MKSAAADAYPDWPQVGFRSSKTINEIDVYVVSGDLSNLFNRNANSIFNNIGNTSFNVQSRNDSSGTNVQNVSAINNKIITKIVVPALAETKVTFPNNAQAASSQIFETRSG